MPQPISIHECISPAERKHFITFAWEIYKNDPYWVPPLISERMAFYDKKKNPFFEHSDAAMFTAKRDGKIVGTIVAVWNNRHNEFHNEKMGFFGGFECVNDQDVANALFDKAKAWVTQRGATALRGPVTLSMNEEVGLLIDGFDGEPQVLMTYNPRYYINLYENYGLKKAMDVWAWWNPITKDEYKISSKLDRVVELVKKRSKFTLRKANLKQLDREIGILKKVYASDQGAWKDNWGHVPMTDHEMDHMVHGLKQFADEDLIWVAELDGNPIGVAVTLPNVNRPLRAAYPNPQTPEIITLLKFLWYRRKMVNAVRFVLLGVMPEHRMSGVDAVLIWETLQVALKKGYIGGELSWILETNENMNRIGKLGGGHVYRTYRIYEKAISG
jgi:hypothetical protein